MLSCPGRSSPVEVWLSESFSETIEPSGLTVWVTDETDKSHPKFRCFTYEGTKVRDCGPKYSWPAADVIAAFDGGLWYGETFEATAISLARSAPGKQAQVTFEVDHGDEITATDLTPSGRMLLSTHREVVLLDPAPAKGGVHQLWGLKKMPNSKDWSSEDPAMARSGERVWILPSGEKGLLTYDSGADTFDKARALRVPGARFRRLWGSTESGTVWAESDEHVVYAFGTSEVPLGSGRLPSGASGDDATKYIASVDVLWALGGAGGVYGLQSNGQALGEGAPVLVEEKFTRATASADALVAPSPESGVYVLRHAGSNLSSIKLLSDVRGTTVVAEPGSGRFWVTGLPLNGDDTGVYCIDTSRTPIWASRIARGVVQTNKVPVLPARNLKHTLLQVSTASSAQGVRAINRVATQVYVLGDASDIDKATLALVGGTLDLADTKPAEFVGDPFLSEGIVELHWAGAALLAERPNRVGDLSLRLLDGGKQINQEVTYKMQDEKDQVATKVPVRLTPATNKSIAWERPYTIQLTYQDQGGLAMNVRWPNVAFKSVKPPVYNERWFRTLALALLLGLVSFVLLAFLNDRRVARRWVAVGTSGFGVLGTAAATFTDQTLNVSVVWLSVLLSGEMLLACIGGLVSMSLFRELLEITPFDLVLGVSLRSHALKRLFYRKYVDGLRDWIANGRREAHHEEYASPPVTFEVQGTTSFAAEEPAEFIAQAIANAGDDPVYAFVSAPGGLGKSALLRRVIELTLDAWERNPDLPLPILCSGDGPSIAEEFANPQLLDQSLVSVEYHEERMRQGDFFVVLDGLSEAAITPKALGGFIRSKFSKGGMLVTSRPDRAFEGIIRSSPRWVLATPQPLKADSLRNFIKKYATDDQAVDQLVKMVAPLKGANETYSPILVRLGLMASPSGADLLVTTLASVYQEALQKLLEKVEAKYKENIVASAATMCVETYWADASRTLPFANAPPKLSKVLVRLKEAGVVIAVGGVQIEGSMPTLVRFFHDSIQSFLTARGLFQQGSWTIFRDAASRREFLDQKSELFSMCVEVFEPKAKVLAVLRAELLDAAGKRSIRRVAELDVIDALPEALRQRMTSVDGGSAAVLRVAVELCKDSIPHMAELFGALVVRLVEADTKEAAGTADGRVSYSGVRVDARAQEPTESAG